MRYNYSQKDPLSATEWQQNRGFLDKRPDEISGETIQCRFTI
ncbi:hypothetical protein SAMN06296273_0998 [Nitrosomonas ureae]|uniref:Uncharacterized protein n=1 Tax=Nitrosomonas ureae TaxID=44577 RepID=A0A285BWT7_9PROT|nr:hypothetical protein SAMN06296273_0998 [Nitrosomonas ureae]